MSERTAGGGGETLRKDEVESVSRRRFLRATLVSGAVGCGFLMTEGRALAPSCSPNACNPNNCGMDNSCGTTNNCGTTSNTCGTNQCAPNYCPTSNTCDFNECFQQNYCGNFNSVGSCVSGNVCTPNSCGSRHRADRHPR